VTWLITSSGPQLSSSWGCCQCPQSAEPGVLSAEKARAEARTHVETAGHQVSVYRGTVELLVPLATEVPTKESAS
jgi:hypothetical protein